MKYIPVNAFCVWSLSHREFMFNLVMLRISWDVVAIHSPSTLHKQGSWLEHAENLTIDFERI